MKETDRKLLRDIRAKCQSLAEDLKKAGDAGYQITFNIDGAKGVVNVFSVSENVAIDLKELDS